MLRSHVIVAAIIASLLLTSCASPGPEPQGSGEPSTAAEAEPSPTPAQFPPCEGATLDALRYLFAGDHHDIPSDGVYPPYLPLPSCVFEEPDQMLSVFLEVSQADLDALRAAVEVEQGAGTPEAGDGLITGYEWPGDRVGAMYLVPPGYGTDVQYIQLTSVITH